MYLHPFLTIFLHTTLSLPNKNLTKKGMLNRLFPKKQDLIISQLRYRSPQGHSSHSRRKFPPLFYHTSGTDFHHLHNGRRNMNILLEHMMVNHIWIVRTLQQQTNHQGLILWEGKVAVVSLGVLDFSDCFYWLFFVLELFLLLKPLIHIRGNLKWISLETMMIKAEASSRIFLSKKMFIF